MRAGSWYRSTVTWTSRVPHVKPYASAISELEEALTLKAAVDGHWQVFADARYQSLNGMFGGWTAAILLRAVMQSGNQNLVPSSITVNFVDRIESETTLAVRTRHLGGGSAIDHWQATIGTNGPEAVLAQAMVVLSERRMTDGHTEPTMPEAPDPDSLPSLHPPGNAGQRTLIRPVHGLPPFGRNHTSSLHWTREASGRVVDHVQLAFLADACAPRPFFWSDGPRMSATLTLSTYFHATGEEIRAIGDDYVLTEAIGTRGAESTSGQQARLWSRRGDLLATTVQLAWYR